MKRGSHIILGMLVLVKILAVSLFIYQLFLGPLFLENMAIAADQSLQKNTPPENTKEKSVDSETISLDYILKKKAELQDREAEIKQKRAELLTIQADISQKLKDLNRLREEIRQEFEKKETENAREAQLQKTEETKRLALLKKAYASMKPQKAASLIEKLDLEFAVLLLSEMKGDAVGKILSYVELERAAKISEGLAK